MISVSQAIAIIMEHAAVTATEDVPLRDAAGRVLAQDVASDVDVPPFHKSSMDGYAFRAEDCQAPGTELHVVGVIPAGTYPDFRIGKGEAARIMTGAPLPDGADSVQMVEKTEALSVDSVRILETVPLGKNVARKSEIMATGDTVLAEGTYITPAVLAVLATVGKSRVTVHKRARVAILVTGDELVEIDRRPAAGQIRNSNGYAVYAQVAESGAVPHALGIARDNATSLGAQVSDGLGYDVLLISGGVSMGDYDIVEDVLAQHGVEILFDKINIKPGKPAVFGKTARTLVFGLPGNPVSASTVFEVFVKPALRKMQGFAQTRNTRLQAVLETDHHSRTVRECFHPGMCSLVDGRPHVRPLKTRGSADILGYARSNCYIITPSGSKAFKRGELIEIMLRDDYWKGTR